MRKTFIEIPKIQNSRNWFRYEIFIHLFEFKGFSTWGERDTIVSSQSNQRAAPVAPKVVWPRPGLNLNLPVRTQELNSLLFLKSPNPQPTLPVRDVTDIPLVLISIWDFYFDISEWRILSARAWTPALMFAPN